MIKYTNHFLGRLEDLIGETDYMLRYEKGSFKSGCCLLKEHKVIVVNKYYPLEGRINSLVEIIRELPVEPAKLSEKGQKMYAELQQASLFEK